MSVADCGTNSFNQSNFSIRFGAGWSSLVARKAHNLEVSGSNPFPATKFIMRGARVLDRERRAF
jgi:hypothetical protein